MENLIIPELYCPFPSAVNTSVLLVQQHTNEWARHFKLVQGDRAYERLSTAKFGWLAARAYPQAGLEELKIISDWNVWLFMLDDQCDETGIGKQPERLRVFFDRFMAILNGEDCAYRDHATPLEDALRDLWQRMRGKATESWVTRFLDSARDYFDACIWEATNRSMQITPTVESYIQMRPLTGGLNTDVDLIDLAEQIELPPEVRTSDLVQKLTLLANNVVCWSNDIISLEKELKRGDVHNLVLTLQHQHQLSLQEAVNQAARLHDAEVTSFLELEQQLPTYGAKIDADLSRYVSVLRSWMRGNIDWSHDSGRYRPTPVSTDDDGPSYLESILTL